MSTSSASASLLSPHQDNKLTALTEMLHALTSKVLEKLALQSS